MTDQSSGRFTLGSQKAKTPKRAPSLSCPQDRLPASDALISLARLLARQAAREHFDEATKKMDQCR